MPEKNVKLFIYPLISLGIFIVLVFGAAYAYLAGTKTMNTANYHVTLPQQTSLVCTKTDCNVTLTPAQASMTNTDANNAAVTSTCSVACTCSGTKDSVCAYNVFLVEGGTVYTPSTGLGDNKEFTVKVTTTSGCSVQNSSGTETQVNTQRGKIVAGCLLTVPAGGTTSSTVNAEFKWYNLSISQNAHASKVYKYQLSTGNDIPDAYQQVQYLQSSGTQYIDTKVVPTINTRVDYKLELTQIMTGSQPLLGARTGNANPSRFLPFAFTSASNQGRTVLGNTNPTFTIAINTIYTGSFRPSDNVSIINGTSYSLANHSYTVSDDTNTFYLFATSGYSGVLYNSIGRLYYVQLYNSGTLVRNFIPCVRKLDNVAGMYDTVNSVFYTNDGTGTFTTGPNV